MTNFENLSSVEQACINQARREDGKPPLGTFARGVQASAALQAVAQDFAPPPGGERRFEISIKDLQVPKPPEPFMPPPPSPTQEPRWTTPSEPQPSSFAESVAAITVSRLGRRARPKVATEPDPEPGSFREALVRAIKRRRPQWRQPSN